MNRIEKAVIKASKESRSLRDLLTYQEAYKEAVNGFYKDKISLSILKACTYAVKSHTIWMLETADADQNIIAYIKKNETFNWGDTVYYLMDHIPSLGTLIEKHIIEAD
jgi:hypothetical protein